jgi:hypothetical protein
MNAPTASEAIRSSDGFGQNDRMKIKELPATVLQERLQVLRYRRRDKCTGYVYGFTDLSIFADGTAVKIGHGQSWQARISGEQVGNPRKLIPVFALRVWNHQRFEADLHTHLRERNISGEWFSLTPEHVAVMAACLDLDLREPFARLLSPND